jgi:hypothetical protein
MMIFKDPFAARDVARLSESSLSNTRKYIGTLSKAGYLKIVGYRRYHNSNKKETLYRLIKKTGPKAPKQHNGYLYDPNTDPEINILKKTIRKVGVVKPKICQRKKFGTLGTKELSKLNILEQENRKLKNTVAELSQYKLAMQEILSISVRRCARIDLNRLNAC